MSPAFLIEKKNEDLRLVGDYREVNKYIEDDNWVNQNIEDSLTMMGENKYFSKIDLSNGFDQIRISEESKKYTSFFLLGL